MALSPATLTYADVLNVARSTIPALKEDDFAATICNMAVNLIWSDFDWRESIVPLPPFYLTPLQQDYGSPAVVIPADFGGLRKVHLTDLQSNPTTQTELRPLRFLDRTSRIGMPEAVGYVPELAVLRVFPLVPGGIQPPRWTISGTYKKNPPVISAAILNSPIPFQDKYFLTMLDAVRWAAAAVGGSGELANSRRGIVAQSIMAQAAQEGVDMGDTTIHPSAPLGFTGRGMMWSARYPGGASF